jgi:four helix bundle protein
MLHTKTRLYEKSLELISLSARALAELPVGYGFLADQLRRASASTALNFAEGSGKISLRDRRRFFLIARASALETAAAFDVAERFGALSGERNAEAQELCDHLSAMLYRYR